MAQERLQKIIAKAGIASRRSAEKYITDGRVQINGTIITELGTKADPDRDEIFVEGHGIISAQSKVYLAVYKPPKVMSTTKDPEGRQTLTDLIQASRASGPRQFEGELPRIFAVGRLDWDSEGLVLMTNDGDLANRLIKPQYHVPRVYAVKVRGKPDSKSLDRLRQGVRLRNDDGSWSAKTIPAEVQITKESKSNTWLELTLFEGKNHQVKRMCESIGHPMSRLIRINFGGVPLEPLMMGGWRFLTSAEVESLRVWGIKSIQGQRKKR